MYILCKSYRPLWYQMLTNLTCKIVKMPTQMLLINTFGRKHKHLWVINAIYVTNTRFLAPKPRSTLPCRNIRIHGIHLGVIVRDMGRMGDKTTSDDVPSSLWIAFPSWLAAIYLPQSECPRYSVSFIDKKCILNNAIPSCRNLWHLPRPTKEVHQSYTRCYGDANDAK